MSKYLETLNETIREYFSILSEEFPDFLLDYIETPRMQKQDKISVSCIAKNNIDKCINYTFDRFIYMEFYFSKQ